MKNFKVCVVLAALLAMPVLTGAGVAFATEGFVPDGNMERSEIPDLYKWSLDAIFTSDAEWEKAVVEVLAGCDALKSYEGKLEDPVSLSRALETYFGLHTLANRVTLYANLIHDSNMVAPENQTRLDKGLQTMDSLMNAAAFLRKDIMLMDDEVIQKAYAEVPELSKCKPYIEGLRRRRGILLSDEGERILALAGDNLFAEIDLNEIPAAPEKAFKGIMSDIPWPEITDEDGKKVQLSLSSYGKYRGSSKREVRAEAVEAFFKTLKQYQHALAASLAGQAEFSSFLARSRGYSSAMEAYLDKDNLSPAVVVNLVDAINANLRPLHKYMELRKKVMGVDSLRLYDLYVPMVEGVEKEINYDEAREMILTSLAPLGPEYTSVLVEGMELANGWVDLFPCKNKDSGAFSASVYGVHPYVKMNYFNTLDDASTLAHEFGHALHTYFSMKTQPPASSKYVSFIAEVASTFNETLLAKHLIANAKDKAEKLYLLNQLAESIRTTIYRQTLFAEFEMRIHNLHESGTTLTADLMCETYANLIKRYYGDAYTMGENDDIEWAYIPHFYWKFYVFTYATGLSTGISLAQTVLDEGEPARLRYMEMLKSGCAHPPLEILKNAGADLTKPDVIKAAADLLDATLDEMAALMEE